jgi:hypothetical protein
MWFKKGITWEPRSRAGGTRHGTGEMVHPTAYPLRCQFPALWLTGVSVSVLCGLGTGLRLALAGEWRFPKKT